MKTFVSTCFAAALVLLSSTSFAAVWRVNNNVANPAVSANFTALTTAAGSALVQPGDTLYLEGSPTNYGSITLTKQLVIIGTGYFLTNNDTTQANNNRSLMSGITFNAGSEGSVITGVQLEGSGDLVNVNADDVTIDRCYLRHNSPTGSGAAVRVRSNRQNTIIRKSFIKREYSTSCCSDGRFAVDIDSGSLNTVLDNNIIIHFNKGSQGTTYNGHAIRMNETAAAIIRNNVINGLVRVFNSVYNNNIHIVGSFIPNQTMVSILNNIGNTNQYGTDNGNQSNVNMNDVFEYGPGNENTDNHYVLKAGSPAIAAGVSGVDCGAFGGNNPYVLSGMPAIPAIFETTLGSNVVTSASGLQMNVKSKAHD